MRLFESLLVLASLVLLGLQLRKTGRRPPWRIWVSLSATPLMLAHLVIDGYRVLLIPAYLVTVFFLLRAIMRVLGQAPAAEEGAPEPREIPLFAAAAGILVILAAGAASVVVNPLTNDQDEAVHLFLPPRATDVSGLGWTAAFDSLHRTLQREYAFGAWKAIPWEELRVRSWAAIAAAQARGDRDAYYLALRGYAWSFPDGHVRLAGDDGGLRRRAIGAGFGLGLIGLDDGRIIAHVVPDGPADRAGLPWGSEVLRWNGAPIDSAIAAVTTLWAPLPPATREGARAVREQLLSRGTAGDTASIAFRPPGDSTVRTAVLRAMADNSAALVFGERDPLADADSLPVSYRILDEGVGYVRIRGERPVGAQLLPSRTMRSAVRQFGRRQVQAVILDVRGNRGEADKLVTLFLGHFSSGKAFYEYAAHYRPRLDQFVVDPEATLWIEPRAPRFDGRVLVLVDRFCANSCEGIAMAVARLPKGSVVGLRGTSGSFGMTGGVVRLPEGLALHYPTGRSLDSTGVIQIDSDSTLRGGVRPDARVPLNDSTARAAYRDNRDIVLDHALGLLRGAAPPPREAFRAPTPSSWRSAGRLRPTRSR